MSIDRKKAFGASAAGFILAAVPFLFWHMFLKQLPLTNNGEATIAVRFDEQGDEVGDTATEPGQARLRELFAYPAHSLALDDTTGKLRFYGADTGRSFEVLPETLHVTTLSEQRLESLVETHWSPNGSEVVSLFREGNRGVFRYFDYRSGRVASLDNEIERFAFSPSDDRMVSVQPLSDSTRLRISSLDGNEDWLLMTTRLHITDIAWPSTNAIALISQTPDQKESLSRLDLSGTLSILLDSIRDLEMVWARGGSRALVSFESADGSRIIEMHDLETGQVMDVPLETRASKCGWHQDGRSITCGVPTSGSTSSRDDVWTHSFANGQTELRYRTSKEVWLSIESPIIVSGDDALAFLNPFNKRPYLLSW